MKNNSIQLHKITLIICCILSIFSCKKKDDITPVPTKTCSKDITISYTRSNTEYNKVDFISGTYSSDFVTFKWAFGDGQTSSNSNPTNYYPEAEATYPVHFTATTSCGETITIDTTVSICPSCFTYKIKCDTLNYLIQNGASSIQIHKSGDYGDLASSGDYLRTYSVSTDHSLKIQEGGVDLTWMRQFTLQFGNPSNYNSFGFPVVKTYSVSNQEIYSGLTNTANSNSFMGQAVFNQPGSSGNVMVTQSDSVLVASFTVNLIDPSSGGSRICNGDLKVSRYRYYYE